MPAAILPALISAAGSVIASAISKPKKTAAPAVEAPTRMPGTAERDAERKKSMLEQQQRKGRAATILTDTETDALGG